MPDSETARKTVVRPPFGAPHVFVLAVVDGNDVRAIHRISRPETVIGRGEDADFPIEDGEVSKRHCLLRTEGGVCTLKDLGSLNGTRLNGRDMRDGVAQRLRHLDEIHLGNTRLLVLSGRFKPQAE